MVRRSISADPNEDLVNSLTISPETVCYVIVKAHEFDVKDVNTGDESGSSASDDSIASVLEERGDDPVFHELVTFISGLTVDERIELVALAWLGREDYTIEDWPTLRDEAAQAQGPNGKRTATYLLGMPMLGDYLEEGLSMFGKSCESYE
ncbi:MAG TPA: DUF3775 domain-containing protein [Hyphomicrobiales bacterium]|nr:DUF3775 domain-containing protein [Hyphomicrobiales bacterium]